MSDNDAKLRGRFKAAVANLPLMQREIFLAHRVGGLSYTEIARVLGLSEREVERQFARAMYKLMKQMNGHRLSWWERCF